VQTIGLTLADAEFVASKRLSAREVAQLLGVPATLLDIGDPAQKPLSPEHEESRWNRHFLEPRLARIEGTINADPSFFGPGAKSYVAFGDVRVKADARGEASRVVQLSRPVSSHPDEGRAELGLAPHPDGSGRSRSSPRSAAHRTPRRCCLTTPATPRTPSPEARCSGREPCEHPRSPPARTRSRERLAVAPLQRVQVRDATATGDGSWTIEGYAAVFEQETTSSTSPAGTGAVRRSPGTRSTTSSAGSPPATGSST
jgi:hypothetical protein